MNRRTSRWDGRPRIAIHPPSGRVGRASGRGGGVEAERNVAPILPATALAAALLLRLDPEEMRVSPKEQGTFDWGRGGERSAGEFVDG